MAENHRLVVENFGRQQQGVRERITWEIDVSVWGDDPSDPDVLVMQGEDDVTADVVDGAASVNANIWQATIDKNVLTPGKTYKVFAQFTIGGNELEAVFEVRAT